MDQVVDSLRFVPRREYRNDGRYKWYQDPIDGRGPRPCALFHWGGVSAAITNDPLPF